MAIPRGAERGFYFLYDRKKGMAIEKKHEKEKRPESREMATVYMRGPSYCPAILLLFFLNLLLNSIESMLKTVTL